MTQSIDHARLLIAIQWPALRAAPAQITHWVLHHKRLVLLGLLAALTCALGIIIARRYKQRREQQLSHQIRQRKKAIHQDVFYSRFRSALIDLYNPSLGSITIICSLVAILGIIGFSPGIAPTTDDLVLIARRQAIELGIALLFVPFTVFVIGLSSRRTESGVTIAEVLLKETFLFPVVVFVLGLLADFAFLRRPTYAGWFIVLTLLLGLFCIFRICRVLLDEHYLHDASIRLLQDKIRRGIGLAVDQRLGRNLFLTWLEDKPIEYSPFSSSLRADQEIAIHDARAGVVRDIYLDRLAAFIQKLESCAKEAGFAFAAVEIPSGSPTDSEDVVSEASVRPFAEEKHRYLTKLIADGISEKADILATFPAKLVPDALERQELTRLLRISYAIGPGDSYPRRVERYLVNVKEDAILAIRDHRVSSLSNLLNVYEELADTFLEEMRKVMGGHSFEAARQERQNILGGWKEVQWISSHLREIQQRGCLTEDAQVARLVVTTPVRIAYKAIRYRDHLLFDVFTQFVELLYHDADRLKDTLLRKSMKERCSTYLSELGDYGIGWELDSRDNDPQTLEAVGSLATLLLLRFHGLLKSAIEKGAFEDFRQFLTTVGGLFLRSALSHQEDMDVTWPGRPYASQEERDRAERLVSRAKTRLEIVNSINNQRKQLFFSLGSLLLSKSLAVAEPQFIDCLKKVDGHLGTHSAEITSVYLMLRTSSHGQVRVLPLGDVGEEGFHFGETESKLDQYLCYLLLKCVQTLTAEQIANLELSQADELVWNVGEGGSLPGIYHSFENDRQRWGGVIPAEWLVKVPHILAVFKSLIESKARSDEDIIIKAAIDDKYVSEFRKRFWKRFRDASAVRRVFQHFNAYLEVADSVFPKASARWGFNLLDNKAAYVEDSRKSYANWPEEYATNLATSENGFAFHSVLSQLPQCPVDGNHGAADIITAIEAELRRLEIIPNVFFIALQSGFFGKAEKLEAFVPEWQLREKETKLNRSSGFRGMLMLPSLSAPVPVFSIWTQEDVNWGCALDLSRVEWQQESPLDDPSEQEEQEGFLFIKISDLSHDEALREKMIQSNPAWLRQEQDKHRYLSQRVILQAFERFQVTVGANAGMKFDLRV